MTVLSIQTKAHGLNKMKCFVKVVLVMVSLFSIKTMAYIVTSRPVPMPPQLFDLIELVKSDINYRYTDAEKRMTAIKDKDLVSCFVTNYDPHWNLYKSEKVSISQQKPFQTVNTTSDFVKLRAKAGKVIANMCKRVKIFWLNEPQGPPLPGSLPENGLLPPPIGPDQALVPPPQLFPGTEIGNTEAGSKEFIPPPAQNIVPVARKPNPAPALISDSDSVQAPPLLSGAPGNVPPIIETPPPLAVWLQMQNEKNQPPAPPLLSDQNRMLEPPKLPDDALVAPPIIPVGNGQNEPPRTQREIDIDDLHEPPAKQSTKMLEPLPDLRTPPSPFRK